MMPDRIQGREHEQPLDRTQAADKKMGAQHSSYELPSDAWPEIIIERLKLDGYRVHASRDGSEEEPLFEIRQCADERTALSLVVHGSAKNQGRMVDVHWLLKTLDRDPRWMVPLALRIEIELIQCGAKCVFGSVASDPRVRKAACQ